MKDLEDAVHQALSVAIYVGAFAVSLISLAKAILLNGVFEAVLVVLVCVQIVLVNMKIDAVWEKEVNPK